LAVRYLRQWNNDTRNAVIENGKLYMLYLQKRQYKKYMQEKELWKKCT